MVCNPISHTKINTCRNLNKKLYILLLLAHISSKFQHLSFGQLIFQLFPLNNIDHLSDDAIIQRLEDVLNNSENTV